MANKKHIVLVSYFFPPTNHVAARRAHAFYKYLDRNKYDFTIVTAAESKKAGVIHVNPNKGLRLRKTTTKFFFLNKMNALYNRVFLRFFLDENQSWTKSVYSSLEKLHKEKSIDILITSFAPLSSLLSGNKFIKNNPNVKWVMDMRDELSSSPFISEGRRKQIKELENEFLTRAEALISVSQPIVEEFEKLAGELSTELVTSEIRNGFDFSWDESGLNTRNNKFNISYLGSFYASRKPDNFFKALIELSNEGKVDLKLIQVNIWSSVKSYIVPGKLSKVVVHNNSITEADSINAMRNSDALLLIHPANGAKGVYTGKLFEYLGVLRPVLALVDPTDVAAQLITEAKAGEVAANEDIEGIKLIFLKIYNNWKEKVTFAPELKIIQSLHRKDQVAKFDKEVLEKV